jgi:hypothetical protein
MNNDPVLFNVCAWAAVVGLALIAIGRIMLFFEVRYLPWGWKLAAWFLPLGDLLTLSRFWDTAKRGALIALAGMLLLLPFGALAISQFERQKATGFAGRLNGDQKKYVFQQMREEHMNAVENKQEKCNKLNGYLNTWYQSLQAKRPTLTQAQMADFNKEAAAYASFRVAVQEEAGDFSKLESQSFEFNDMKDADYDEFVQKKIRKMKSVVENSELDPDTDKD